MAKPDPSSSVFDAPLPRSVVAGIGCRRGADAAEIIALVESALLAAGRPGSALVALASLDRKADEPGLVAAAAYFGVALHTFTAAELANATTGSHVVQALVGTSSVAEAAARQAGPLILRKMKSAHVTCALAIADPDFGQAAPASTATIAASRSLTSNAGP